MTQTATKPDSAASVESSDRELVATRVFDAPRDLVFKVWTDPKHIGEWWGPRGFTTTTYSMDMVPGGVWRFCMHGPDGVDYQNRITYLEVVEPERIVYKHGGGEDVEPVNFEVVVTFEDQGGKTKLTMRMTFPSPGALKHVVETYGADKGLEETVDRMGEYVAELVEQESQKLKITLPSDSEIVLTRTFDAPRPLVFEVCTKPEHIMRWWGCLGSTMIVCEIDLRPGGAWRHVLRMADGSEHPFKGEYMEIVPPERTVSTYIYDVDFIRDHLAIETATYTEHDGRTTLSVNIRHKTKEARDGHFYSGMEAGARETYLRLAEYIKKMV